jgi:hypothetical protein
MSAVLIYRDQSLTLKFKLAPVFLSTKIKIDLKQELKIPAQTIVGLGNTHQIIDNK